MGKITNVPDNLREMWADIYKLYDINYNMKNTGEDWKKFWDQATELLHKHNNWESGVLVNIVSELLEGHVTGKQYHPCTLEDMKLF